MSIANLVRWSGLMSVLAGVLYALGALLHPVGEDAAAFASSRWVPAHLVYLVAVILMQFGLVGLYARQAEKVGWLGLAGFVLAFIGTAFVGTIMYIVARVIHFIANEAPALFDQVATPLTDAVLALALGYVLGYSLLGAATMRAGVLPRWSGLMLIIGAASFFISEAPLFDRALAHGIVTFGDVTFGLGLAWMGYALWSERRVAAVSRSASLHTAS
jgi:hypothetical protein